MTKDEALKMALEALEDVQDMMTTSDWFNERVQAVRQALDQLPDAMKMTDKLTKAKQYLAPGALVPIDMETTTLLLEALRQALAESEQPVSFYVYEWVNPSDGIVFRSFRHDEHHMGREPDRTIAVPEPHTGIDRGAWSDVPDATKWVDELRGGDEWTPDDMAYRPGGLSLDDDIELAPPGNYVANPEPPTDSVIIAGAIYDFSGFLTTRDNVIKVGSTADAAPVVDLIKEWADKRGLSLKNAAVSWWQDVLEESPNSTTEVVEPEPVAWVVYEDGVRGLRWSHPRNGMLKAEPLYTAPPQREWVGQYAKECEAEVQRLKEIIDELENDDPPPKREWVGLTRSEINKLSGEAQVAFCLDKHPTYEVALARAVEAKLKEKNT